MRTRIARDRRRAGVRVILGARDQALLRALARFRVARTDDLTALFFAGVRRDTASTRLRKLHDARFIEARLSSLSEQNAYQLGPAGRAWADEHGVAAGPPPAPPAAHHLTIVRLWARLAAALAADQTFRLHRFEPDWEVRTRLAGTGAPVVPDAAIEIGGREPQASSVTCIALEVDLTTERPGVLRRKLSPYEVSHCFAGEGPVALAVVLVGAGERRVSSVRSLVESTWTGIGHVLLETEWPSVLLRQLREGPPTPSPSGKGMVGGTTLLGCAPSPGQGEGLSHLTSEFPSSADGD
ncbi:MAG: replication-relaxation family protein [Candidatus Eisenbacteria bacterium]|nr:replication-relaxation family protein [Candidatus Eisenbacteria bacterium]